LPLSKSPTPRRRFTLGLIVLFLLTGGLVATAAIVTGGVPRPVRPQGQMTLPPPPVGDLTPRGTMHTIVIDPGHGGDDEGVHGVAGAKEKDVVLQIAQRLKAAIETRLQMKVLLTRDGDETVAIDTRAVFANTNKADLFLSLHANASVRPTLRGTEVLTLSADDYRDPPVAPVKGKPQPAAPPPAVPVVSGGIRVIEPVRWDLAQLPFVERSAMFSATLVKRLAERAIPSNTPLASAAPLRVLVGANMPAILIELGFLTNAEDEAALTGTDVPNALIEAILDTIGDVRFGFPSAAGPRIR
jgi:N-acetylmuramoyl-L-alanine amidase